MKKFIAMLMSALMVAGFTGCGSNGGENVSADADKVYAIGTDTTFAPFEFQNKDGEMVGIDMELLAAIAEVEGFKYEVTPYGFDAAVQALEAQQVDGVIAGMSITEKRKESFDFSDPYFDSGVIMGVADSNDTIKGYENLKGQKVAVKSGTEGLAFANQIKDQYGFETVVFEDSATMYEDVKLGNTVACFEDYPVLGYAINQGIGLKTVTEKEAGNSYGFAVAKGQNQELIQKFNSGLAKIKENGKYQEILDKYIAN